MVPRPRTSDRAPRGSLVAVIYHLALPEDWATALDDGLYTVSTRGLSIEEQGYMHACGSRAQSAEVRAAFYNDRPDAFDLVLDEGELSAAGLDVRLEPGDPADPESELFPHVYGGPVPVRLMTPLAEADGAV